MPAPNQFWPNQFGPNQSPVPPVTVDHVHSVDLYVLALATRNVINMKIRFLLPFTKMEASTSVTKGVRTQIVISRTVSMVG